MIFWLGTCKKNPKAVWKKSATIEDLAGTITQISKNRDEIYKNLKKLSEKEKEEMALSMYFPEYTYEKQTLAKVQSEKTSALSVAGNVLDYSVYSLHQRWKASHSNDLATEVISGQARKYDKKIYAAAKLKLIDQPISKFSIFFY